MIDVQDEKSKKELYGHHARQKVKATSLSLAQTFVKYSSGMSSRRSEDLNNDFLPRYYTMDMTTIVAGNLWRECHREKHRS